MADKTSSIWTIILAAGASSRFGGIKALAQWKDGTLLSHAIETAQAISPNVLVVTGAHHAALLPHLTVPHIYNENWESGMGTSIACGIAALPAAAALAIILPVDQPLATPQHLHSLIEIARDSGNVVFTQQGDVTGPPVALPCSFFPLAATLKGDAGLKHCLKKNQWTAVNSANALRDIDTPADLSVLLSANPPEIL